jgi:hypothetical protein
MISIENGIEELWGWGAGAVAFVLVGVALVVALERWSRSRAEHQRALALEAGAPPLVPGPIVLRGTVETWDERPAVEVRIEQEGREYKTKNGFGHEWKETFREATVRPFSLVLPDGTKIEVRPPDDVRLADDLAIEQHGLKHRTCVARLARGESVAVSGVLEPAPAGGRADDYRGGDTAGYRLVPRSKALLSAEHLAASSARWSDFYLQWTLIAAATLLVGQGLLWDSFYDVALRGERQTAVVSRLDTYRSFWSRRGETHYVVEAMLDDLTVLEDDVARQTHGALRPGDPVPWLVVPGMPRHQQIGRTPQVSWVWLLLFGLAHGGIAAWCASSWRSTARWWERRRLVENASGRLSD